MHTTTLTHEYATCTTCDAKDQEIADLRVQNAALQSRMICPGWGVTIAGQTLDDIQVLARVAGQPGEYVNAEYVDVCMFDIDYLKQINIAAGSQGHSNEWIRPALTMRRESDRLARGQVDGADMFMALFEAGTGDGGIAYIEEQLTKAPMTDAERQLFIRAVCRRSLGPLFGDMRYWLHRLGWKHRQPEHPTITKRMYYRVHVSELEQLFAYGDKAVFDQKAARGIGR